MPTPESINDSERTRGLFLNALFDETEDTGRPHVETDAVVRRSGLELVPRQVDGIVNGLIRDSLASLPSGKSWRGGGDVYEPAISLTARGADAVRQWVMSPDKGTEALPLSFNQTNHFHASVNGSSFISQPHGNVTVNIDNSARQMLDELTQKIQELLKEVNTVGSEREDVESDIETASGTSTGEGQRRTALRHLGTWAKGLTVAGVGAALQADVQQLIDKILRLL